jgi:2-amino-4-hydroxy-6-hydroxymethyldihydropteridine diphosphokinase
LNNVAIAVGSNVGDRQTHIEFAVGRLSDVLSDVVVSSLYETEPVGVEPQPSFLNGAIVGQTSLGAHDLLHILQQIERERGRERPRPGAPRTLDLDLILYGDEVIDEPDLKVPHPRFRERLFVLEPLAEIVPDWIDPVTGRSTKELRDRLT